MQYVRRLSSLITLTCSLFLVDANASTIYYTDTYTQPQLSSLVVGLDWVGQLSPSQHGTAYANGVEAIPGSNDFLAIDRAGLVYQITAAGQKSVLLDVASLIGTGYTAAGGQKGLQYATPHPDFLDSQSSGYMKLYTTTTETINPDQSASLFSLPSGLTSEHFDIVSEWDLSSATPTRSVMMVAESPYGDHNVRWLGFDSQDDLYISFGDGGNTYWRSGDTVGEHGFGQDPTSPLGTILKVTPDGAGGYTVPSDNPHINDSGYLAEIYAMGFRNPQHCWFDDNDNLYCGDIGQRSAEEVNLVTAGGNYGWTQREGDYCVVASDQNYVTDCGADSNFIDPLFAYSHLNNLAGLENRAIGGVAVCDGCGIAALEGFILATDLAAGTLFSYDPFTDTLYETLFKDMQTGLTGSYADLAGLSRVEARLGNCGDGTICYSSRRDDNIFRLVSSVTASVPAPSGWLLLLFGVLYLHMQAGRRSTN